MDLLLLIDNDKSHHVYMKDFDKFMFHKRKNLKKWFCKSCLVFQLPKNIDET